ncbi:MAG: CpXC domain-containing protein [Proteobacteria bacterium]|nr:CpXC domain-containing protein [Pseudomonadota bacterium]
MIDYDDDANSRSLRIDWENREQVETETRRLFEIFPHLPECASSDGGKCPRCGSSQVKPVEREKHLPGHIRSFHCQDCGQGYTRYHVDPEHEEKWGPTWHSNVISFQIEGYPHYLYFKPGTHIFEGLGPDVFPWER